ncbi:MAG: ABC-F family ATP-binding cassette domain-containing protein, partial [Clostridia bacterium]|nr:ABC-F family ATP-binding cassette domain-containing protein [Clostridia bacterium]
MQVLSAQKIRLSFGVEEILKGADLTIDTGARIGLVGQNGCGKSTLLRVLTGEYEPDSGTVSVPRGIRIGYLEQIVSPFGEGSVWNQLLEVFAPVFRMEEELRTLEHRMGIETGAEYDRIVNRYDRLTREFEDAGGYAYKSRIQGTLIGLGFTPDQYDQEASTLSGGQQARLALARLLLSNPDLLLLDEPTNHLDLSAVQWLEDFLRSFHGAILIVSHDRYFLNTLATEIVELHQGVTERYTGNYTRYLEERKTRREIREKAWQLQQQEIQRQEDIIEKLRSYNREKSIKRARSREKILEKIEVLDRPDQEESLTFRFQEDISSGEDVLFAEHLSKAFGPLTLFEEYHLHVRRGERIAIIGPNGCGKS